MQNLFQIKSDHILGTHFILTIRYENMYFIIKYFITIYQDNWSKCPVKLRQVFIWFNFPQDFQRHHPRMRGQINNRMIITSSQQPWNMLYCLDSACSQLVTTQKVKRYHQSRIKKEHATAQWNVRNDLLKFCLTVLYNSVLMIA